MSCQLILDCLPVEISGTSRPHQNSLEWSSSHSDHTPPEYCNIDMRILESLDSSRHKQLTIHGPLQLSSLF